MVLENPQLGVKNVAFLTPNCCQKAFFLLFFCLKNHKNIQPAQKKTDTTAVLSAYVFYLYILYMNYFITLLTPI